MRNAPIGRVARRLEPIVGPNVRSHMAAVCDGMAKEPFVLGMQRRLGNGVVLIRGLAYLIDGALFVPVVALLLLLTGALPGTADAIVTPMVQFGPFLYLVVLHRLGGQTLGKSLTGLRVVRTHSEAPISWRQSMVRAAVETGVPVGAVAVALLIEAEANVAAVGVAALVFSIVVSNLWAAVDCGAALFDSEQRTLHDRAAGTRVARVGA